MSEGEEEGERVHKERHLPLNKASDGSVCVCVCVCVCESYGYAAVLADQHVMRREGGEGRNAVYVFVPTR